MGTYDVSERAAHKASVRGFFSRKPLLLGMLLASVAALNSGCGHSSDQQTAAASPVIQVKDSGAESKDTPGAARFSQPLFIDPEALKGQRSTWASGTDVKLATARSQLIQEAEKELLKKPYSVMNKTGMPPSQDKHDYYSMVPVSWPDPGAVGGRPYKAVDGKINPEEATDRYDKAELSGMAQAVHTLALSYFYTNDTRYAAHAAELLRAWFLDPNTRMNPNLVYGQVFPGADELGTNLIDGILLLTIPDDLYLIADSKQWMPADDQGLEEWMSEFLSWLQMSSMAQHEREAVNNHSTWFDVIYSTLLVETNRSAEAKEYLAQYGVAHLEAQIKPDGSMPYEMMGASAVHNSLYNLQAFGMLAELGQLLGVDLWHERREGGGGIKDACLYLLPYVTGEKKWNTSADPEMEEMEAQVLYHAAEVYKDERLRQAVNKLLIAANSHARTRLYVPMLDPKE